MGNSTIYREMENKYGDKIRGDAYEHKVPFYAGSEFFKIEDTAVNTPMYMMSANNFISCFYAFKAENIVDINSENICLKINNGIDKFMESWKYALLADYNSLSRAFENATTNFYYKSHMLVRYLDLSNHEVANNYNLGIINFYKTGIIDQQAPPFSFVKDKAYENQQEYRYVVGKGYNREMILKEFKGIVEEDFMILNIGDISNFSVICEADMLFYNYVLMDIKNKKVEIIKESK